jgi:putative oxidoreductase
MNIALWIVQGLLAAMYLMAGTMKTFQTAHYKANKMSAWAQDRSNGYLRFIGVSELLGAVGLVLPMLTGILPWLTFLAALGLSVIQLLAILTVHLPRKEFQVVPMNAVLLALAMFVAVGRWGTIG